MIGRLSTQRRVQSATRRGSTTTSCRAVGRRKPIRANGQGQCVCPLVFENSLRVSEYLVCTITHS